MVWGWEEVMVLCPEQSLTGLVGALPKDISSIHPLFGYTNKLLGHTNEIFEVSCDGLLHPIHVAVTIFLVFVLLIADVN